MSTQIMTFLLSRFPLPYTKVALSPKQMVPALVDFLTAPIMTSGPSALVLNLDYKNQNLYYLCDVLNMYINHCKTKYKIHSFLTSFFFFKAFFSPYLFFFLQYFFAFLLPFLFVFLFYLFNFFSYGYYPYI